MAPEPAASAQRALKTRNTGPPPQFVGLTFRMGLARRGRRLHRGIVSRGIVSRGILYRDIVPNRIGS